MATIAEFGELMAPNLHIQFMAFASNVVKIGAG